ncbi:MAG: TerB family tellurite resistance protein [Caulobacteraceae bacterium]|nr:TerB family tellurite resistance protein [Caulobacter sp.]
MDAVIVDFLKGRQALAARCAMERLRRSQTGSAAAGPDSDDMQVEGEVSSDAPPLVFELTYADNRRAHSHRIVTLRRIEQRPGDLVVVAFCHLRTSLRSFLASRIVELIELSTGEVSSDAFGYFMTHPLVGRIGAAGVTPEAEAVRACQHELVILTFLSAADGNLAEAEEDAVVLHVLEASDEALNVAQVRRLVRNFTPDAAAFTRAIRCLRAGAGDIRALRRSMRRVMDADGEVAMEESLFADAVLRLLA